MYCWRKCEIPLVNVYNIVVTGDLPYLNHLRFNEETYKFRGKEKKRKDVTELYQMSWHLDDQQQLFASI